VFVRGYYDNALWHRSYTLSSGWSSWQSLGGVLGSAPVATSSGPNTVNVYGYGSNNNYIWQKTYTSSGWSIWTSNCCGSSGWSLPTTSYYLNSGHGLQPSQYLVSPAGAYTLLMQSDGNLVGYQSSGAFWATGTNGRGNGNYNTQMQGDGNLVVYSSGTPLWASGTERGSDFQYQLAMQDDRNIVISMWQTGYEVGTTWASNTHV